MRLIYVTHSDHSYQCLAAAVEHIDLIGPHFLPDLSHHNWVCERAVIYLRYGAPSLPLAPLIMSSPGDQHPDATESVKFTQHVRRYCPRYGP